MDYENCRHLTVVGLHDTRPRSSSVASLFHFCCGFQSRTWRVTFSAGFLRVCPVHLHFLLASSCVMRSWLARAHRSLFLIFRGHRIFRMFHRQLMGLKAGFAFPSGILRSSSIPSVVDTMLPTYANLSTCFSSFPFRVVCSSSWLSSSTLTHSPVIVVFSVCRSVSLQVLLIVGHGAQVVDDVRVFQGHFERSLYLSLTQLCRLERNPIQYNERRSWVRGGSPAEHQFLPQRLLSVYHRGLPGM